MGIGSLCCLFTQNIEVIVIYGGTKGQCNHSSLIHASLQKPASGSILKISFPAIIIYCTLALKNYVELLLSHVHEV